MKDKKLCLKCKYHGTAGSRIQGGDLQDIVCDYWAVTHKSCLTKDGDRRGNEVDNCLLFEEGKSLSGERKTEYVTIKAKRRVERVNSERSKELPSAN